jgi:nucleotide-binding universal stress UspA family protein
MSDAGSLIPISDEQAKAIQEALKVLQGLGGYLKQTFGTVPEDVIGLLGGDWLRVKRAENIVRIVEKARERLRARGVEATEPPSLSVVLPILVAAADESRDELQDIWAALLAAAADPSRAKSFRIQFIETVKKMDPLDAAVLQSAEGIGGAINNQTRNSLTGRLQASRDQVDVSVANLEKLELVTPINRPHGNDTAVSPFGREFLRAVSD